VTDATPSSPDAPVTPSISPPGPRVPGVESGPRPLPPLTSEARRRRAIVAISVCLAGATPSFALAAGSDFSLVGMLAGVAMFMVGLVMVSWSDIFRRWNRRPFVRRTLTGVYSARMAISIAWPVLFLIDGLPGALAISVVTELGFQTSHISADDGVVMMGGWSRINGPIGTCLIVMVQGVFLNLILLTGATGLLVLQRLCLPSPEPTVGTTFCGRCGHCLDGVPESHACPECGFEGERRPEPVTWIDRWPRRRLVAWAVTIPALVIGIAAALSLTLDIGGP